MKKIAFLLFLFGFQILAQHTIKGELTTEENLPTWLILYQLKGAEQKYVLNDAITNGKFEITLPNNAEKGVYRLMYASAPNSTIDFLFLGEDLALKFNHVQPNTTLHFKNSESNKLYLNYIKKTNLLQQKIDSIQLHYFNLTNDDNKIFTENLYKKATEKYVEIQNEFETNAKDGFVKSYIKQQQKYYAPTIIASPQMYLNSEREN
ncbi:MAG TPA: hypothetical protein VJ970_02240, partial [Flavobacteriaceae bacterium]|nr:hypothetical protein [Flavobacteriaceae bacterium]